MTALVKKAVFPVAGLGTRFLPATKANPKEMLPIVDKPLIQYAVEEALAAGATEMIFVTSASKRALEDHFDSNFELETKLRERGKLDTLKIVEDIIPKHVSCAYVRQHEALGLGHAVLCAKPLVGNEPFMVLLADDLIDKGEHEVCMKQMVDCYARDKSTVLAVQTVPATDTDKYGIVSLADAWKGYNRITAIVEKPKPDVAPSTLAAVGRYVLTPRIFHHLEHIPKGAGGELQLTDAIARVVEDEAVFAFEFLGTRYDCGDKLGYLKATIHYALQHPEVGEAFTAYLAEVAAPSPRA
ncbi:MAG: UTP--glucose-1-phosphate uridylyltransferase [marine bacterium B5-7]|nr:MAG: UTP--glucose-1-phosphate uridylyltransferase [marine bacterium B5-7]